MIVRASQITDLTIDEAFEHLAKSIVIQAIEDYRFVLKHNKKRYTSRAQYNQIELEKFFLSDWCYILSGYDGQYLMDLIQEQENYHGNAIN